MMKKESKMLCNRYRFYTVGPILDFYTFKSEN